MDVVSAVSLLGPVTDRWIIERLRDAGYHGVRPGHGYVVQRLLTGPQTVTDLASTLGVTQQAVSKTVAELAANGYVERVLDRGDRRRQPVALSRRGQAMVEQARLFRGQLLAQIEALTGSDAVLVAAKVLQAGFEVLGLADAVTERSVPAPPE